MKISVFGNQDLAFDSWPVKLIPDLEKALPQHEFIHQDPNEDVLPPNENEWWIIDTVAELDEVKLIKDIESIKITPRLTMHDYDLGMHLQLIKKIYPNLAIRIIGVPMQGTRNKILKDIINLLAS